MWIMRAKVVASTLTLVSALHSNTITASTGPDVRHIIFAFTTHAFQRHATSRWFLVDCSTTPEMLCWSLPCSQASSARLVSDPISTASLSPQQKDSWRNTLDLASLSLTAALRQHAPRPCSRRTWPTGFRVDPLPKRSANASALTDERRNSSDGNRNRSDSCLRRPVCLQPAMIPRHALRCPNGHRQEDHPQMYFATILPSLGGMQRWL